MFLACFFVAYTIARPIWGSHPNVWFGSLLVGALVSSALALKFLGPQRDRLAAAMKRGSSQASEKFEGMRSAEDED